MMSGKASQRLLHQAHHTVRKEEVQIQITGGQSNKTDTTRADTLAHRTTRMRLIGTT
jgi:hypothetical protein